MVVDTSALVAHVLGEPEGDRVLAALEQDTGVALSAASLLECVMVLTGRRGEQAVAVLDRLLARLGVAIVPVTEEHITIARRGFLAFGKGRHPAALNFGDCFSYALAIERGEPLLFVGNDFSQTDVKAATY